jgi:MFS family permease
MNYINKTKSIYYSMEFTHGMRRALMSSLALVYFIYLGFSVVSVTTLFAVSVIILTFFEFPTGAIADYDSRKRSVTICFLLMSFAFFGLFFFKNFWLLAASWILMDISWTFYSGAGVAWAIDNLKFGKKKSKIVSLISRTYLFEKSGYLIGGLIGALLATISFRYVWLFVSLTNLSIFFVLLFYMEEKNFRPAKAKHGYLKKSFIKAEESFRYIMLKGNRELRTLMIAGFVCVICTSIFFIGVPLLLTQNYGLSKEYLPIIYSISGAFALLGPLFSGKLLKKIGFRQSLYWLFVLVGAAIILFALSNSFVKSIVFLFVLGTLFATIDIIGDSANHNRYSSKLRASLGSVSNIMWSIAHSIAVFFAGLTVTYFGVIFTLLISAGVSLITAAIYFFGLRKK